MSEDRDNPFPVSVITGFLGSGKTTLLSRLLADPRMANSAVIINEFGEVGLDHFLVTKPKEDVVLLSSGCLCCNIRGDLVNTLASLSLERSRGEIPPFDRVLIETTGLAEPAPVLMTVVSDPDISPLFRLERVITTVDAVHGLDQFDRHPESVKQVCVADYILLTKIDLVKASALKAIRERVHSLNPGAEVLEVVNGEIDPAMLFDDKDGGSLRGIRELERWEVKADHDNPSHGDTHTHTHLDGHQSGIRTFSIHFDHAVTPQGLGMWMNLIHAFKGRNLLRIKGILNMEGRPVVLQAVQHLFHPLTTLPEWPTEDRRSRIVFITHDIERQEIERTIDAFGFSATSKLDPAAFSKFKQLAAGFGGARPTRDGNASEEVPKRNVAAG